MNDRQGVPGNIDVFQRRCVQKRLGFDESYGVTAKIQSSEIWQISEQAWFNVTEVILREIQALKSS